MCSDKADLHREHEGFIPPGYGDGTAHVSSLSLFYPVFILLFLKMHNIPIMLSTYISIHLIFSLSFRIAMDD
jgi:hypothetical protein